MARPPFNPFAEFPALLAELATLDDAADAALEVQRQWYEMNVKDCLHEKTKLYVTVCVNGVHQYRKQCQTCGHVFGPIAYRHINHHDRQSAGERNDSIRERWLAPYYAMRDLTEELKAEARGIRWAPGFRGMYMASPQWAVKRLGVMRRANYQCEECKLADADEIHHVTYSRLGNEDLEHLKAVCSPCHRVLSIELGHVPEREFEEYEGAPS